jgi:Caspase domain/PASTA domain
VVGQRKALIVANDTYEQEALQDLQAPAADAEALGRVLGDPQIGDFAVQVVHNEPAHVIQAQIEEVFSESRPDDVLLLHFSGHGLKSESGELFFAAANTRPNRLGSTAVSADFVQRCMRNSRSRSVVLLLDCCYGGAFAQGVKVRAAGDVHVLDSFPQGKTGGGRGRAVITASSAMEFAFEGDRLGDDQPRRPSVFTTALVQGLATGEADRDEDGWVSLDELYDYLFDKVREQNPHQTPSRQFELEGELYLARSRRRRIRPAPIPADLQRAIADPNVYTRLGAVGELRTRLASDNLPAAAGACEALAELARTDVRYVAEAAAAALSEAAVRPDQTQLHFGRVEQGSSSPRQRVQLLGPLIARTCEPFPTHDWIHADQTAASLDISIDTAGTGPRHGSVGLKGPAGEATITIDVDLVPAPPQASPFHTQDSPAGRPALDPATPTSAPETPAAIPAARQPGQVTQPLAEEQASREPDRSATITAPSLDPDSRLAPLTGLAGSGGPDDHVTTDSQADDAWPGESGPDTRRPERKRSRRRSPVLLAAVLVGLAATGVAAGVVLTHTPPTQPVISPVSYRFAAHQYHDGLVAVRRWALGGRDGSLFTETITASSASGKALPVLFKEPIPVAIAANLQTVRFTPAPSKIVNADPVVEWELQVPAHGTVTVGYQATVAPAGTTRARLARWVTDFNQLAVTVKPGPVQGSGSGSHTGSGPGSGSGNMVVVPDVSGQTQSQATATLQSHGLTVNPATTSNCPASSDGQVVGQNPSAGMSVHPGFAVIITVCSASQPPLVVVPDVVGMPEGQAEAVLQNAGLVAAVTTIPDCESGGLGLAISETPDSGSIPAGATVEIDVGGPCTSTPPPTSPS